LNPKIRSFRKVATRAKAHLQITPNAALKGRSSTADLSEFSETAGGQIGKHLIPTNFAGFLKAGIGLDVPAPLTYIGGHFNLKGATLC